MFSSFEAFKIAWLKRRVKKAQKPQVTIETKPGDLFYAEVTTKEERKEALRSIFDPLLAEGHAFSVIWLTATTIRVRVNYRLKY